MAPDRVLPVALPRASGPVADAAKSTPQFYASAAQVLPVYARDALAPARSERDGTTALVEPVRASETASVPRRRVHESSTARVKEVEDVIPTLTRDARSSATMFEPLQPLRQPVPMIDDTLRPVVGMPGVDTPVHKPVTGHGGTPADPGSAMHWHADPLRASSAADKAIPAHEGMARKLPWVENPGGIPGASASDRGSGYAIAAQSRFPEWLTAPPKSSRDGPSRADAVFAGLIGLATSESRGRALASGVEASSTAMDKRPDGWLAATKATEAIGAGLLPPSTRSSRDRGSGINVTPHPHGYHPHGDQPGPVIQHITHLHLDDREIARAVTRHQLRMMGGNVSGTLRPDPSIAPHYGAHLLET